MSLKLSKRLCFIFAQLMRNYQDTTTSWHLQSATWNLNIMISITHAPFSSRAHFLSSFLNLFNIKTIWQSCLIQQDLTCAIPECLYWSIWSPVGCPFGHLHRCWSWNCLGGLGPPRPARHWGGPGPHRLHEIVWEIIQGIRKSMEIRSNMMGIYVWSIMKPVANVIRSSNIIWVECNITQQLSTVNIPLLICFQCKTPCPNLPIFIKTRTWQPKDLHHFWHTAKYM